jgi:hypothetical protein
MFVSQQRRRNTPQGPTRHRPPAAQWGRPMQIWQMAQLLRVQTLDWALRINPKRQLF